MTTEALLQRTTWLRGLARALLLDDAAAEDVVQETWIRALESQGPEASAERPWLAQVTRNLALNVRRSRSRRKVRELRAARSESVEATDQVAERLEIQRLLVDCVLQLKETYREVLVLRYFDELEPIEIAHQLGLPRPTVHTRLRRALVQLRATLAARTRTTGFEWRSGLSLLTAGGTGATGQASLGVALLGGISMKTIGLALSVALIGLLAWSRSTGSEADAVEAPLETNPPEASLRVDSTPHAQRYTVSPRPTGGSLKRPGRVAAPSRVVIRVTNTDGVPQSGVPVVIRDPRGRTLWEGRTSGAAGEVQAHAAKELHKGRQTSPLKVSADVPVITPPALRYPEVAGSEPLVLVLPRTVRLEVRLLRHDGRPFDGAAAIAVHVRTPPPPGHEAAFLAGAPGNASLQKQGDVFTARQVESDCVAVLRVVSPYAAFEPLEHTLSTRTAGDVLPVTIRLPKPNGFLIARLLRGDGRPLPNVDVRFRLVYPGATRTIAGRGLMTLTTHRARTDEAGLLRIALPQSVADPTWARFVARLTGDALEADLRLRAVERRLSPRNDEGNVELGDLDVTELPLLARGKVVNEEELSIAGALVRLERAVVNEKTGSISWSHEIGHDVVTDEEGDFLFYGAHKGKVRLHASARHHGTASATFDPPTRDLLLRVSPPQALRVRVLADDWVPWKYIGTRLVHAQRQGRTLYGTSNGRGEYRFESVEPGPYDLEARVGDHWIAKRANVQVTAATQELPELDVCGLVQTLRLSIRNPDGSPCAGQQFVHQTNHGYHQYERTDEWGQVSLWYTLETAHVDILFPEHRAVRCLPSRELQVVQLAPGYPIELRVRDLPLALQEKSMELLLIREGKDGTLLGDQTKITLDSAGTGSCRLSSPGTYKLQWLRSSSFGGMTAKTFVKEEHPKRIRIRAKEDPQIIEVTYAP